MLTTRQGVHVLATPDLTEFLALAALDPVVNVFVDYRARTTRLDRRWLGGEVWGRFVDGRMVSACHVGANLVPVQAGPDDVAAFAERARGPRRGVASIVGPQVAVEATPRRGPRARSANAATSSGPACTGTRLAPTWQAETIRPSTNRPQTSPPSQRRSRRVVRAR